MKTHNVIPVIGIVGCGPRGLSALESLYSKASGSKKQFRVILFEASAYPGAGPVYALDQSDSNWLNVCERAVGIRARHEIKSVHYKIPAFPDYQHWSGHAHKEPSEIERDHFPKRSTMGNYLNERFKSIASVLEENDLLEYVRGEVIYMEYTDGTFLIEVAGKETYQVDEAVLSIGHQPIELDGQLEAWQSSSQGYQNLAVFTKPYPLSNLLACKNMQADSIVAIRGFGLAMVDVMRALTQDMGGSFKVIDDSTREMVYVKSGAEIETLVPFSLDGLPMAPKPLNKKLDDAYVPTKKQLKNYGGSIQESINSPKTLESPRFLINAIVPIITTKYIEMGKDALPHDLSNEELENVVTDWLLDEDHTHELILSKSLGTVKMLERFIGMATGHIKISLDFCIGHVWRHCQPTMYKLLSFAPLSDQLISDIVALDERLKRYSYGPPVDSLQQMVALVDSGKLNLDFVNDPKINLDENGWNLKKNGLGITANIMINSVLDAPRILKVVSLLPKGLINGPLLEPLHDALGIRTAKDATIEKSDDTVDSPPLAVLGRLAKGTLIGVDAIAECFGARSEYWAEGAIKRN